MNRFGRIPSNRQDDCITEVKAIGFPPITDREERKMDPKTLPQAESKSKISEWLSNIPSTLSPPPHENIQMCEDLRKARIKYETSYTQGIETGESSWTIASDRATPFEIKLAELEPEATETKQCEFISQQTNSSSELPMFDTDPSVRPRLKIPKNYDENHSVAKALAKVNIKFRPRDDDGLEMTHDPNLSLEVGDMDSDDNKFEASELIEYKDHSWCIAVPIDRTKIDDTNIHQHLVYSYQSGIDRLFLTTEQTANLKNTLIIKYKKNRNRTEAVPVYSALPSTGLISLKYRHNKGIEIRVYGIVNFVDFVKDPNCSMRRTMVWTDALGPIYLTAADRSNIRRKLTGTEEKIFAPLRMCMMTVRGEFNLTIPDGSVPKWTVMSFQPLIEEVPKDPNIGRNLWPARILRFDDLFVTRMQNGDTWLNSHSSPHVNVFAGAHLSGVLRSAGPKYTEKGLMMGFVVPFFVKGQFVYYEALVVGPPRVVMILTEGRFLNYCPKTWPPKIEKLCERYQKEHELKRFARKEPRWKPPHESTRQMKSLRGFHEFHFDFKN